jgi:hypothetical protein
MIAVNETFYENCSQQQLDAVLDACH